MSAFQRARQKLYPVWARHAKALKLRRVRVLEECVPLDGRILEIGAGTGKGFASLTGRSDIVAMDLEWRDYRYGPFTIADASRLPFADNSFDIAVSIGVFEHIQPIEDLCRAASEIRRVARHFLVLVPSIGTFIEPHKVTPLWQLRDINRKEPHTRLNYFSDEAWLQLQGFRDCRTRSFWYIPGLIKNLVIYR